MCWLCKVLNSFFYTVDPWFDEKSKKKLIAYRNRLHKKHGYKKITETTLAKGRNAASNSAKNVEVSTEKHIWHHHRNRNRAATQPNIQYGRIVTNTNVGRKSVAGSKVSRKGTMTVRGRRKTVTGVGARRKIKSLSRGDENRSLAMKRSKSRVMTEAEIRARTAQRMSRKGLSPARSPVRAKSEMQLRKNVAISRQGKLHSRPENIRRQNTVESYSSFDRSTGESSRNSSSIKSRHSSRVESVNDQELRARRSVARQSHQELGSHSERSRMTDRRRFESTVSHEESYFLEWEERRRIERLEYSEMMMELFLSSVDGIYGKINHFEN